MRFSVVTPAYNDQRFLEATVQSVVNQTVSDWEMVIIDDGSKDSTFKIAQELAKKDARVRAYHQDNAGVAAAGNRGYRETSPETEFILFLDHDDVLEPDALETLKAALDAYPDAVAAHGLARFVDSEGKSMDDGWLEKMCRPRPTLVGNRVVEISPDQPTTFASFVVSGCVPSKSVVLFRRSVLEDAGLFDTDFSISTEYDLYFRTSRRGNFAFVDKVVLGYRQHDNNLSNNNRKAQREEERRVVRKMLESPENSPAQSKLAHAAYRAAQNYHIRSKMRDAGNALKKGSVLQAAKQCAYAVNHLRRYIAGRP
jgi:glycosyltransferase involved in cell wall biosynthesis